MRKIVFAVLAALGLVYAGAAFAGGVPLIPSTSQFSEPSQIISTLNTLIRALNGQATGITSAPGNVSLGKFCRGSSATTAVTCNGARGILSLTNAGTIASGNYTDFTVTNTNVTAGSACVVQVMDGNNDTGSAPAVSQAVPTANTLSFRVFNGSSVATGAAKAYTVGFQCFQ